MDECNARKNTEKTTFSRATDFVLCPRCKRNLEEQAANNIIAESSSDTSEYACKICEMKSGTACKLEPDVEELQRELNIREEEPVVVKEEAANIQTPFDNLREILDPTEDVIKEEELPIIHPDNLREIIIEKIEDEKSVISEEPGSVTNPDNLSEIIMDKSEDDEPVIGEEPTSIIKFDNLRIVRSLKLTQSPLIDLAKIILKKGKIGAAKKCVPVHLIKRVEVRRPHRKSSNKNSSRGVKKAKRESNKNQSTSDSVEQLKVKYTKKKPSSGLVLIGDSGQAVNVDSTWGYVDANDEL